jgi:O-antigen/teichoic acid export membrane protein
MNAQKLLLRGSGAAVAGFGIRFGARALFLLIAGHLYGVASFGAFSIAVAVVELAVAIAGLGSKRLIFKLLDERPAGRPAEHVVYDAALLVAGAGLLIAALIVLGLLVLPVPMVGAETEIMLAVLAPMIAGQALLDLILAATRWHHVMRYEVVGRSVVEPYAATAGTFLAWLAGWTGIGLALGYWAGTLAALGFALFGTRRLFATEAAPRYRPHRADLVAMLRGAAWPTLSDGINAFSGRLDVFLVGFLLGQSPAGIYAMARQIRIPVRQVRQSFDGILTPLIARTLASGGPIETGKAAASATRFILAIQLAILVALIAIGKPLLGSLGSGFAVGYTAMIILTVAESIQGAFGVSDLLFLYRRPVVTVSITALTIVVNAAAALLLIGPFGVIGAASSVLLANLAAVLARRIALNRNFGIRAALSYNVGPVGAAAIAGAGAMLVVWVADPRFGLAGNAAACVAGLGLYAALLYGWMAAMGDRLSLAHLRTA